MEKFMKGDIVIVPFMYSDFSGVKKRPALIVANLKGDDIILCEITSQPRMDSYSVKLDQNDICRGKLNTSSIIRPNKIFTTDSSLILYKLGTVTESKIRQVEKILTNIFTN